MERWRCALAIVAVLAASSLLFAQPAFGQCNFMPFDVAVRQADAVWLGTVTDATVSAVGSGLTLTVSLDDVLKGHETTGQTVTATASPCNGPLIDWNKQAQEAIGKQQLFVGHYADGGLGMQAINLPPQVGDNPTLLQLYQLALKDLGLPPASVQGMPPTGPAAWVWRVAAAFAVLALVGAAAILLVWRRSIHRVAHTYAVAAGFVVVGIMVAVLIPTTRTVGPYSKLSRGALNQYAPVYFNHHVALRIAVALLGVALAITVMAVGTFQRRRSPSKLTSRD